MKIFGPPEGEKNILDFKISEVIQGKSPQLPRKDFDLKKMLDESVMNIETSKNLIHEKFGFKKRTDENINDILQKRPENIIQKMAKLGINSEELKERILTGNTNILFQDLTLSQAPDDAFESNARDEEKNFFQKIFDIPSWTEPLPSVGEIAKRTETTSYFEEFEGIVSSFYDKVRSSITGKSLEDIKEEREIKEELIEWDDSKEIYQRNKRLEERILEEIKEIPTISEKYEEPETVIGQYIEGLELGYRSNVKSIPSTLLRTYASAVGNRDLYYQAEEMSDKIIIDLLRHPELFPPEDMGGLEDPRFYGRMIGQTTAFMGTIAVVSAGTAILTKGLGASPALQTIFSTWAGRSSIALMEKNSAYYEYIKTMPPEEAEKKSNIYGILSAIIEESLGIRPASIAGKIFSQGAKSSFLNTAKTSALRTIAKTSLTMLEEGSEEAIQDFLQKYINEFEGTEDWDSFIGDLAESFRGGLAGSIPFSLFGASAGVDTGGLDIGLRVRDINSDISNKVQRSIRENLSVDTKKITDKELSSLPKKIADSISPTKKTHTNLSKSIKRIVEDNKKKYITPSKTSLIQMDIGKFIDGIVSDIKMDKESMIPKSEIEDIGNSLIVENRKLSEDVIIKDFVKKLVESGVKLINAQTIAENTIPDALYAYKNADRDVNNLEAFRKTIVDKIFGKNVDEIMSGVDKKRTAEVLEETEASVYTEMVGAEAGRRLAVPSKEKMVDLDWMSMKSSFPKWVPSELRSRKLFDKVQKHILEKTSPEKEGKVKNLYDLVQEEIQKRARKKLGISEEIEIKEREKKEVSPEEKEKKIEKHKKRILSAAAIGKKISVRKSIRKMIEGEPIVSYIKKKEKTLLQDRIRTLARGVREGRVSTKKEIKSVQSYLLKRINQSMLNDKHKSLLKNKIKNIQTYPQFVKEIRDLREKIPFLENKDIKETLLKEIKKELKKPLVTKQGKGKYGANVTEKIKQFNENLGNISYNEYVGMRMSLTEEIRNFRKDSPREDVDENMAEKLDFFQRSHLKFLPKEELAEQLNSLKLLKKIGRTYKRLKIEKRRRERAMVVSRLKAVLRGKKEVEKGAAEKLPPIAATDIQYQQKKDLLKKIKEHKDFENWDAISDELKNVGIETQNLETAEKILEADVREFERLEERKDTGEEITEESPKEAIIDESKTITEKISDKFNEFSTAFKGKKLIENWRKNNKIVGFVLRHLNIDNLADILDESMGEDMYTGSFYNYLAEMTEVAQSTQTTLTHKDFNTIREEAKRLGIEKSFSDRIEVQEKRISKNVAIDIYVSSKDAKKKREMVENNHLSEDFINETIEKLTPQEKQFGDFILDFFEESHYMTNKTFKEHNFVSLPKRKGYSPANKEKEHVEKDISVNFLEQYFDPVSIPKGMTKKGKKSTAPLRLGLLENTAYYITLKNHYVSFESIINEMNQVFKEISPDIKQKYGNNYYSVLKKWLSDVAGDGRYTPDDFEKIGLAIRKGYTKSLIANLVTITKQTISLSGFLTELPEGALIKGMPVYWKNKKMIDKFFENVPQIHYRSESMTRDMKAITEGRKAINKIFGNEEFTEKQLIGIRIMDQLTVRSGATAAYLHYGGKFSDFKTGNINEEAMRKTVATVRRTQIGGNVKDLAAFQRGGTMAKLGTMFMNQTNKYFNIMYANTRAYRKRRIGKGKLARSLIYSWIVPSIIYEFMSSGGSADEDDYIKAILYGPANYIFFLSQVSNAVRYGFDYEFSPVLELPTKLVEASENMIQGEVLDSALTLGEILAKLEGLPVYQLERTSSGVLDLLSGETNDWRRLIWSKWALTKGEKERAEATGGRSIRAIDNESDLPDLPELPELPELPSLPEI